MAKFIISRWVFPNCVSLLLIFFPNTLHNPDYKCLLSESCLSALHNLYGEPLFFFSAVLHPLSTISHVSGWDFISLLLWENFQLHLYRKKFTILDQLRSLMKYFAYHHSVSPRYNHQGFFSLPILFPSFWDTEAREVTNILGVCHKGASP